MSAPEVRELATGRAIEITADSTAHGDAAMLQTLIEWMDSQTDLCLLSITFHWNETEDEWVLRAFFG